MSHNILHKVSLRVGLSGGGSVVLMLTIFCFVVNLSIGIMSSSGITDCLGRSFVCSWKVVMFLELSQYIPGFSSGEDGVWRLLTWWSNPSIRIVCWHLHPYIPCEFSSLILQVEACKPCFLGYFWGRILGWQGPATEMLSHRIAKVEEKQKFFFSCPLAVVVHCGVGLPDVQLWVFAFSPILELWEAEKLLSWFGFWGTTASSLFVATNETYAAPHGFTSLVYLIVL